MSLEPVASLVAVKGIEPSIFATETNVLPLHYTAYKYL